MPQRSMIDWPGCSRLRRVWHLRSGLRPSLRRHTRINHHPILSLTLVLKSGGPQLAEGQNSMLLDLFARQATADLAFDGRVVPVHLALFAEMMKSRAWSGKSLREVGGATGLGVIFLD